MMKQYKIGFDEYKQFEHINIKPLIGVCGLYLIFTKEIEIHYPFKNSRLIYIGMSEKRTNSIGKRLLDHYDGSSNNAGLSNYRKVDELYFTYLNMEIFNNIWKFRVEDLESYFILDFVEKYGVYPICNNKSGFEVLNKNLESEFIIDWEYFKKMEE